MTAVPPLVPPEIVEKATHALKAALWGPYGVQPSDSSVAAVVVAAVYGDIVEAVRRDALTESAEAARTWLFGKDGHYWQRHERHDFARWLRSRADSRPPTATVGDEQAVPRTPGTDGAQIATQGRNS